MASMRSSSRVSSDASEAGSPQLTPRSKIKALLATVDSSDSEDDRADCVAVLRRLDKDNIEEDIDAEGSESDLFRPRARMAARMLGGVDEASQQRRGRVVDDSDAPENDSADDDEEKHVTGKRGSSGATSARHPTPDATKLEDGPDLPSMLVSPSPQKLADSARPASGSVAADKFPERLGKNSRLQALATKKRKEWLAKASEADRKRAERAQRQADQVAADPELDEGDAMDISDDEGGHRLTQRTARPSARKASKKALEEMNRETQRIARGLQLAHEAKTKKKMSKASLFERFNFKPQTEGIAEACHKPTILSRAATSSSAPPTDIEMAESGTPPSSPPTFLKQATAGPADTVSRKRFHNDNQDEDVDDELPGLGELLAQPVKLDKGKGKATLADLTPEKKSPAKIKRQVRVVLPATQAGLVALDDSDEELQIVGAKKPSKIQALFDGVARQKALESHSTKALRQLGRASSPPRTAGRQTKNRSMTAGELQLRLAQLSREQARLERERKLESLRARGVHVQTEEEREREREQVEDIVTRARHEAEELMARERQDAKKARKEMKKNGQADPLAWDDSSDDDSFAGSDDDQDGDDAIELSGSEEEGDIDMDGDGDADGDEGDNDEEEVVDDEPARNPLIDDTAEEEASEPDRSPCRTAGRVSDDYGNMDTSPVTRHRSRRAKRQLHVTDDDEDDKENDEDGRRKARATDQEPPASPSIHSPHVPTSVIRSATKTFIPGLPVKTGAGAGMSLTQIFAGTMNDSQTELAGPASSLQFMPSPDFPDSQFSARIGGQSQRDDVVLASPAQGQEGAGDEESQGLKLHYSQSQIHGFDSLMLMDNTQTLEMPIDPTQDVGFQQHSPLKQRFIDATPSTIVTDTQVRGESDDDSHLGSPLVRRGKRLRRRGEMSKPSEPESSLALPSTTSDPPTASARDAVSAFKLMQSGANRRNRLMSKLDKSKATEMMDIQAVESDDEHAGLGGADGEDSSEDDEELQKALIDDSESADVNASKLAAFSAGMARAEHSAGVDKLYRDITTGMLRKRRGGGGGHLDLSDSDDGGEARRRRKRLQFAKMQKALLADERIGKIAQNPRNAAFLKSIEDRDSDQEWDLGGNSAEEGIVQDSQGTSQPSGEDGDIDAGHVVPDSQPAATTARLGRKRACQEKSQPGPRPPRRLRDRPSSLAEVRRELSSLLDEPDASFGSIVRDTQMNSDEEDEQPPLGRDPAASTAWTTNEAVVDRLSLGSRTSSSSSTTSASVRLAFAAPSATGTSGPKLPTLLRRATTNSSLLNTGSAGSTTSNTGVVTYTNINNNNSNGSTNTVSAAGGGFGADAKLKRNAGKQSGINYFARENERRARVAEADGRREKRKWKGVEGRSKAVGGLFNAGSFE